MKVFFLCRTGRHTSLLAAALYLGLLKKKPGSNEDMHSNDIFGLHGFDANDCRDDGRPFFVGADRDDTEVYTIGVRNVGPIMAKAANDFISLVGTKKGEWCVIDTSPVTSRWTSAGLCLKKMRLYSLARFFFYLGARRELPFLLKLVEENRKMSFHSKSA